MWQRRPIKQVPLSWAVNRWACVYLGWGPDQLLFKFAFKIFPSLSFHFAKLQTFTLRNQKYCLSHSFILQSWVEKIKCWGAMAEVYIISSAWHYLRCMKSVKFGRVFTARKLMPVLDTQRFVLCERAKMRRSLHWNIPYVLCRLLSNNKTLCTLKVFYYCYSIEAKMGSQHLMTAA